MTHCNQSHAYGTDLFELVVQLQAPVNRIAQYCIHQRHHSGRAWRLADWSSVYAILCDSGHRYGQPTQKNDVYTMEDQSLVTSGGTTGAHESLWYSRPMTKCYTLVDCGATWESATLMLLPRGWLQCACNWPRNTKASIYLLKYISL